MLRQTGYALFDAETWADAHSTPPLSDAAIMTIRYSNILALRD